MSAGSADMGLPPTFASQAVNPLFPTPVWIHVLRKEDAESINGAIGERVAYLQATRGRLGPGDMWQSKGDLAEREPFARLQPFIRQAVTGALGFLDAPSAGLRITGMWLNVSGPKTAHRSHTHPNNLISGVYYVQVDERSNVLTFEDPRPQAGVLRPRYRKPSPFNVGLAHYRVEPGWLLLFPSFLSHSVPPSESEHVRISLSFNVMMADFVESYSPIEREGNVSI